MKRFLFVIVALVFSGVAAAETLSWESPTSRNDGTTDCYMVAVDLDGLRSEPSNSVPISWEKASPARPTNLLIIIE
jgi:hypothetical protein